MTTYSKIDLILIIHYLIYPTFPINFYKKLFQLIYIKLAALLVCYICFFKYVYLKKCTFIY